VFDDSSVDTLMGAGDLDWFLLDTQRDKASDKAQGDVVN
jgi:hypothetical protein